MEFEWNESAGKLDELFENESSDAYNEGFDAGIDFLRTIVTSDEFAFEMYKRYKYKIDNKDIVVLLKDKYNV